MKELQKYLEKYDYQARFQHVEDGGTLYVPLKVLGDQLGFRERNYKYDYDKKVICVWQDDTKGSRTELPIPLYAARLAAYADVSIMLSRIGYSVSCLLVESQEGKRINKDEPYQNMLMPLKMDDENLQLEDTLAEIYFDAVENSFDGPFNELAEQRGVIEGFRNLYLIWRS